MPATAIAPSAPTRREIRIRFHDWLAGEYWRDDDVGLASFVVRLITDWPESETLDAQQVYARRWGVEGQLKTALMEFFVTVLPRGC